MRVLKATVEGYRSIRDSLDLHLDPRVTVILGANDHGKTNLLDALRHLNPEVGFDEERDLNWDCREARDSLPRVVYELELSEEEVGDLREAERLSREEAGLLAFLESAHSELDATEEAAAPLRASAQAEREALDEITEEVQQAKEAREASPDDATVTELLEAARARALAKQKDLENAEQSARAADVAVDAAFGKVSLATARLIEVRAALRGEHGEPAVAQALETAKQRSATANEAEAKAAERASEASSVFETGKASHPEGSAEFEQLRKAASSAEGARRTATREAAEARDALAGLERAVAAIDAHHAGTLQVDLPTAGPASPSDVPRTVALQRVGVTGELDMTDTDFGGDIIKDFVLARLPRVELIKPVEKIPDSVNRESLESDEAVFMRGIFHYAGLTSDDWDPIFTQDEATVRQLADASQTLNQTLRESWSQGSKLTFVLDHNSRSKRIELWIQDPAVQRQYVRASRRSSGFTHFFALKTILHAHQMESSASSYLWVFDEPGVYLHPDGQHDLVQVLETLAQTNQVVYSTHSVFMANKNFPVRHRLVLKTVNGTKIDGKPFRSRWRPAIEALGMSMPGTLLFASRVLLVEGDSDSVLLNAVLQKLIELGEFDRDVNSLGVLPAGDAADAAALVRILTESAAGPSIAALFDGDHGGEKRGRALERLERPDIEIKLLAPRDTTTEDHLPAALDLYPRALANYLAKMSPRKNDADELLTAQEFLAELNARRNELEQTKEGLTKRMAEWSRKVGQEVGQLDDKPSPVGVAREYALLLQAADPAELRDGQVLRRARELGKWVTKSLDLPTLTLSEAAIIEEVVFEEDDLA